MRFPTPRKVATPGSKPVPTGRSPGRPKKKKMISSSRKGNYRHKYNPEDFLCALKAVQEKRMTLGEASKHYGVPKTTLHDRLRGKAGDNLGRPTELSEEEEEQLEEVLVELGTWGFPLTAKDLTHFIMEYLNQLGRTTRHVKQNF